MRTLTVELGERSYPIHIGSGLLESAGEYLERLGISKKSPHLIVTDDQVGPLYLERLTTSLAASGYRTVHAVVAAGEKSKSLTVFEEVMTSAIEGGLDRRSSVLALGGGVVGDLAGFVAATYMRGVPFIQVPTTILAHDSSVGGKVAVNHRLAKNMIGAFYQPEMVLYDLGTLQTLPIREIRAGLAEMVKHGLIWDAAFTSWCREHAEELLNLKPESLGYGLEMGCAIKAQVVSKDERELGLRAILNLGHTLGHAIEAVGGYGELLHGEAISIGMAASAKIAVNRGFAPTELYEETKDLLQRFGLPVTLPEHMDEERLIAAMMHDKKFVSQQLVFVLPREIGTVEIVPDVTLDEVRQVIRELKEVDRRV